MVHGHPRESAVSGAGVQGAAHGLSQVGRACVDQARLFLRLQSRWWRLWADSRIFPAAQYPSRSMNRGAHGGLLRRVGGCARFAVAREPVATAFRATFLRGTADGSADAFLPRWGGVWGVLALCLASTFGRVFEALVNGVWAASATVGEARVFRGGTPTAPVAFFFFIVFAEVFLRGVSAKACVDSAAMSIPNTSASCASSSTRAGAGRF